MRMRALGRIAAATALAALTSLLGTGSAQSADYALRTADFTVPTAPAAVFNNPQAGKPDEIKNHLIDLIDRAEPGTVIKGSMFSFTDEETRAALVAAYHRQVKVQLIVDSHALKAVEEDWLSKTNSDKDLDGSEVADLYAVLGGDRGKDSFVYVCPRNRGCIGARSEAEIGKSPFNHNKFFIFEKVAGVPNLVFQSSANLTGLQRTKYFNNAVTIPSKGLYDVYDHYFADLQSYSTDANGHSDYYNHTHETAVPYTYTSGAGPKVAGPYAAYFFPRQEGSFPNDSILDVLAPVTCGTSENRTKIRVAMYAFTRAAVADRLLQLRKQGCHVYVFVSNEPGGLGTEVAAKLKEGGIIGLAACDTEGYNLHSKYMIIEGTYDGQADKSLVFTGSHNYTNPSLRGHDETVLKIDDYTVYSQFEHNFDDVLSGLKEKNGICTEMP
ncbi:phospholipase D-like domain-containing protein [Streptomyces sp. NPDC051211]|uniref:phospholipase D-like domain-containing protein n=1 Tax=Streptomyces sp. NPDC051211 TaxID=3154643 RepID=UPI003450D698